MNKNSQRGFASIVLLFMVVLVVVTAGAYYYGKGNLKLPTAKQPSSGAQIPAVPTPGETIGWKTYTNTKNNFSLQYPPSFEIVKGPIPEPELATVDNISFSGLSNSSDSNAGVVFSISVNPSDANGKPLQCTANDECLTKWMAVLNKSSNEVTSITKTITDKSIKGFEYQGKNSLYTQTYQYFVYPDGGKTWQVSVTVSNYTPQEVANPINQILSTFKFTN